MPAPHVDSAVVRIDRRTSGDEVFDLMAWAEGEGCTRDDVARVTEAAFAQRRKTIRNSMSSSGFEKQKLDKAFGACDIAPTTRAEALSTSDFIRLAAALAQQG